MAYVIAEPCIGTKDTACVDACPVDCIHPKKDSEKYATEEMLYIDPVECIDCGACVPVCPVSAIFALDDLPEKGKEYTETHAKHSGGAPYYLRLICVISDQVLDLRDQRVGRVTLRKKSVSHFQRLWGKREV